MKLVRFSQPTMLGGKAFQYAITEPDKQGMYGYVAHCLERRGDEIWVDDFVFHVSGASIQYYQYV